MFYRTSEGHGLPRDPFNAIVVPRLQDFLRYFQCHPIS